MVGLSSHNTLTLPDGRRLGYAEYGRAQGFPIVYLHGVPGSRLSGLLAGVLAAPRGARVIAIDRPGYGLSDPQPGRRIIDWPADVRVVADALGLDRFALLGHSGGGPFAAACAYVLAERITGVALVSSMGPVTTTEAMRRMTGRQKLFRLAAAHIRPAMEFTLSRDADRLLNDAHAYLTGRVARIPPVDAEVLRRPTIRAMTQEDLVEAYAQGARAVADDVRLLARPWGFPLAGIRAHVDVWHGELDPVVPAWLGRQVAAAIPGAHAHIARNAGHLMLIDWMDEILDTLVAGTRGHPSRGPASARVPAGVG